MITLFMNAAVKLQSQNCPVHCLFVFIWMSFILNMARSFSVNNDPEAVHYYLGLRAFEVFIYWKEIRFPHKSIELEDGSMTLSVSDDWLAAMTKYIPVMAFTFACCEFLPLSMAIYFGEGSHLYYPMVAASMVLVVISLLVGAVGGIGNSGKMLVNAFDSDHLLERYELITLIFTGELCFAAGKPGNAVGSNGVMFMAFAAYLLTFKSYPLRGHIKFWARSVLHSVVGLFLYAGVFCAIPAMGSAFARIITDEEGEEDGGGGGTTASAGDLLCYSAGSFMAFTALINTICVDPSGPEAPKISSFNRGMIRGLSGVGIWSLAHLIPEDLEYGGAPLAAVLVPAIALASTSVEIWAVGSLKFAG